MDKVFLVNSAIDASHVPYLSVFNTEERFKQTLDTLDSIDKHCPGSAKYIFDMSPSVLSDEYMRVISERPNTWFIDMGKHEYVQMYSLNGLRGVAETYAFGGFLDWFKQQNVQCKRIYKLSGRYTLNDNFVPDSPLYDHAFVFAHALPSWMDEHQQQKSGCNRLYRLRLWHMDYTLLEDFTQLLPKVFEDCVTHGVDIEHAYYKHIFGNYKTVEVDKIGVTGVIGPSGEFIDE